MTKIKLCGLSGIEEIEAANELKPEYIGFVFAPKSRRYVTPEKAAELKKQLSGEIQAAGVFVNEAVEKIAELLNNNIIDIAQLHGDEDEAYIRRLRQLTGKPIIKAFQVKSEKEIADAGQCSADYILLDSGAGTGTVFDWNILKKNRQTLFSCRWTFCRKCWESGKRASSFCGGCKLRHRNGQKKRQRKNGGICCRCQKGRNIMTNPNGRFGIHGGQYIPETLMNAVIELEEAYNHYKNDPEFNRELTELFNEYAGRPSRLYYAKKMTKDLGGAKIYLKREDLNHTGAHKINNVLGQALLAKKMGKTRLIAETGAGQHGVATATAAALMGMECVVFMGEEDTIRQALNVYRMRLLGAEVIPVKTGTATLKDAVSEAMREWTSRISDTHYCLGSVMGPHPFPTIVRDFQAVISKEIKEQMLVKEGRLPDAVIACVGGGSNAIGSFYHFIEDESVRLIGCEAAGRGVDTFETAATIATGRVGIFHGMKSYFCQNKDGQIAPVYSISAGLDYPGVGPEHAHLHDIGRAEYVPVTDDEAVNAFEYLAKTEGIIPAIESAHAVAYAMKLAPTMDKDKIIVITISGRGDKDCAAIARYRGEDIHE